VIKVTIESVGKEIDYGVPGASRTTRLLKVKDGEGKKFNAVAFGGVTKELSVGRDIYVTKSLSPNPHAPSNNYFVLRAE
jgi:ATP:corrinoid adenosyltransferase